MIDNNFSKKGKETMLWVVKHYWAGDGEEPSVYHVESDMMPTEEQVIEALELDYEPDNGENLEIDSITPDAHIQL